MERKIGPLGWCTPSVLAIIEKDPDFIRTILTADRPFMHLLGLVLTEHGPLHAEAAARLGPALRTWSRKRVLDTFAPGIPLGLERLLVKLQGDVWRPGSYRRLACLETEPHARKWLRHTKSISRRDLLIAERLPPVFRRVQMINALRKRGKVDEFLYALAVARQTRPDLSDSALERWIATKGSGFDVRKWKSELWQSAKFPDPPWVGDDVLEPIKTYAELSRTARALKNCLRGYLKNILDNTSVIYKYCPGGELVGAVEIVRVPVWGWELEEGLAKENEDLSHAQVMDIAERLTGAGIAVPPWFAPGVTVKAVGAERG